MIIIFLATTLFLGFYDNYIFSYNFVCGFLMIIIYLATTLLVGF